MEGREFDICGSGAPVGPYLEENFPEVENAVRFRQDDSIRVKAGEASFRETRVVYSEPSFFDIFSVRMLKGDPRTALAAPRTLVLRRTTAEKYFGRDDPLGRTVVIDAAEEWTVAGVFEDIPRASHFHFDVIRSFASLDDEKDPLMTSWLSYNFQTYILFKEGSSPGDLAAKLDPLIMSRLAPEIKESMGITVEDFLKRSGMTFENRLQALTDIHLRAGDVGAVSAADAKRAMQLGVVDQDINAPTELTADLLHRTPIGDIERDQRDLRQRLECIQSRILLPWPLWRV